jgi:hypothetical protein
MLYPVVVPEHRRVVEDGVLSGRLVRTVRLESIKRAVEQIPPPGEGALFSRLDFAVRACMNAYGSENPSLCFLSLTTCLEALAELERPFSFGDGRGRAIKELIAVVEGSLQDGKGDDYLSAVKRFKNWAANASRPSATDALDNLLRMHSKAIVEQLPLDHPARQSFDGMAAKIYQLRSKVAHRASLGRYVDEDMHRANQFLRVATTVLMIDALQASVETIK